MPDPIELGADLCELYIPMVFGGRLDEHTVVRPGAFRGSEWPCPGRTVGADVGIRSVTVVVEVYCTCGCHRGEFTHELPPRADRTGVHPTDVLADG